MSDGDGRGKVKGKSRATPQEAEEATSSNESSTSLSYRSRFTASATGLTRSAFNPPTTSELHSQAAAALSNSGKGQSLSISGSGSSALAESSKRAHQANHAQASGTGSAGFRTGHHEQHIQYSENEFSSFLDGIDSFTLSENFGASSDKGLEDAWERSQASPQPHKTGFRGMTVVEQQTRDGEEILAILSSPTRLENQFEAPLEDREDYDWGLSSEQLSQLRAMTKDILPPPETHPGVAPEHPLNLNPNFEGETIEASEQWREQWEGVLMGYTDEVWGGLLPLVKQARQEMEEMRDEESVSETHTALRRLEAILGHLQNR
jgi:hypothetical protein